MSDRIVVRDFVVRTRIGVTDEERQEPRAVSVHLELEVDLRPAGKSDELADTVDYGEAIAKIDELLRSGEFRLLEHAAEQVADVLLSEQTVTGVTVEIGKQPPVPQEVGSVAVRISRSR